MYQLGQRVTMSATVEKRRYSERHTVTVFEESPLPQRIIYPRRETYTEGVIVGWRTVMNGYADGDYEDGRYFVQKEGSAKRVWLVAFDLRRKPVMCFDHQVSAIEEKKES